MSHSRTMTIRNTYTTCSSRNLKWTMGHKTWTHLNSINSSLLLQSYIPLITDIMYKDEGIIGSEKFHITDHENKIIWDSSVKLSSSSWFSLQYNHHLEQPSTTISSELGTACSSSNTNAQPFQDSSYSYLKPWSTPCFPELWPFWLYCLALNVPTSPQS